MINRASRPEATPLAIDDIILAAPGILRMVGCNENRAPMSLVKSTGLES